MSKGRYVPNRDSADLKFGNDGVRARLRRFAEGRLFRWEPAIPAQNLAG